MNELTINSLWDEVEKMRDQLDAQQVQLNNIEDITPDHVCGFVAPSSKARGVRLAHKTLRGVKKKKK